MVRAPPRPAAAGAPDAGHPGELPGPEQQHRWAFEMKWDGVRAVVYLDGGELRLLTRNDREVSATYPELSGLAGASAVTGRPGRRGGGVRRGRPAQLRGAAGPDARPRTRPRRWSSGCRSASSSSTCCTRRRPRCCARRTTSAGRRSRTWTWRGTALGGAAGVRRADGPRRWRPPGRRASRASSPSGATRRTCPAVARRTGSRSSASGCRRWWSVAGRPGGGRREGRDRLAAARRARRGRAVGLRGARRHRVHRVDARPTSGAGCGRRSADLAVCRRGAAAHAKDAHWVTPRWSARCGSGVDPRRADGGTTVLLMTL